MRQHPHAPVVSRTETAPERRPVALLLAGAAFLASTIGFALAGLVHGLL